MMNVGVLGTGMVGSAIASRLVGLGHEVKMGSRQAGNEKAREWAEEAGPKASEGTFADAAAFGGARVQLHRRRALDRRAREGGSREPRREGPGRRRERARLLRRPAVRVGVGTKDSLGEPIQRAFPRREGRQGAKHMNCDVMVDPTKVPGEHDVFICGEDSDAEAQVARVLRTVQVPAEHIVDLGSISAARGTELYVALWLNLWGRGNGAVQHRARALEASAAASGRAGEHPGHPPCTSSVRSFTATSASSPLTSSTNRSASPRWMKTSSSTPSGKSGERVTDTAKARSLRRGHPRALQSSPA